MTKYDLSQLMYLDREIKQLRKKLDQLQKQRDAARGVQIDSVQGSSTVYPYTLHTIPLEGLNVSAVERLDKEWEKVQTLLEEKLIEREIARSERTRFIQAITDSQVRQILTLKYIEGKNWQQVANEIGGGNTASAVRMTAERFLKK